MDGRHPILQDLALFVEIASALGEGERALRAVARRLGLPLSSVQECISRLERRYKTTLITTVERSGSELSDHGRELLDRAVVMAQWSPGSLTDLRVAVSRSLISDILTPAIARFMSGRENQVNLRLRCQTDIDFSKVATDLAAGRLDLAIMWGVEQRRQSFTHLVVSESFGPEFDLVLVASAQALLDTIRNGSPEIEPESLATRLAARRIVTLGEDRQPCRELFPSSVEASERIEVDTLGAAVSLVRARAADFAIVPALYNELLRFRQMGQLAFAPIRERHVQLALFTRKGRESLTNLAAHDFLKMVEAQLNSLSQSAPRSGPQIGPLPEDPAFYSEFYGYYIGINHDPDKLGPRAPEWMTEMIRLSFSGEQIRDGQRQLWFEGSMINSLGVEYSIIAERFADVFRVTASRSPSSPNLDSTVSFVAVFTWCSSDVLVGTWSGLLEKQPTVFAEVWSKRYLNLSEVRHFARDAMTRDILDTDEGEVSTQHFARIREFFARRDSGDAPNQDVPYHGT